MGIQAAMDQLSGQVINIIPLQGPNQPFEAIDLNGTGPKLEDEAKIRDRVFDIGTSSFPEDDGEAGHPKCGRLRARVEMVLRIGYRLVDNLDRRAVDIKVAEDVRMIANCLMNPMGWDAANTDILSVLPPERPTSEVIDEEAIIVSIPFILLYRELSN